MSIIEQAKAELAATDFGDDDSKVMISILEKFFDQWDSGGAVSVAAPVLMRLIAGQPLGPLTGEDSEWIDRSEINGEPMWQNMRCSSVFKDGKGHAYDIDADDDRAQITFPYDPTTRMVRPPVYEVEIPAQP